MEDKRPAEGSSSNDVSASAESSESTVQLNVKTLDSQMYSFHVDKNMPVSVFKGKIASEVGFEAVQQRLIFRGKVLKDEHPLSEYHVENGDTLHLVVRQPTQPQPSSGTSSSSTNAANGNDTTTSGPRNHVGQISHSVVLGTFNVGEQGEGGGVPDISRVIGAVLNSFGIGGQPTSTGTGNTQSSTFSNAPGQASQVEGTEGTHANAAGHNQSGSQAQFRHTFPSQQFNSMPQAMQMQVPLTGPLTPVPTLLSPIPDSLNTLSEFMNRMELVLAYRQMGNELNSPPNTRDLPNVELPSNARGMATPEALSIVLRQSQRLLSGQVAAAISHFTEQLEHAGASTDYDMRSHIQTESAQLGLTIQHLGALFLELGRTILTLLMGETPTESFVNAGPAVYISPTGPNPMMVQPFPLQTSSLFSSIPFNMGNLGPSGVGNAPRHINIHIHAGTALASNNSASGARASNGEGADAGRSDSGVSGSRPMPPGRIPLAPIGAVQSRGGALNFQPSSDSATVSATISDLSSRVRNLLGNSRGANQTQSGESESLIAQGSSARAVAGGDDAVNNQPTSREASETNVLVPCSIPQMGDQQTESHQVGNNEDEVGVPSLKAASTCDVESQASSARETSVKFPDVSDGAGTSSEKLEKSEAGKTVPLGLGLGGLQPKARNRQPKPQAKTSDSGSLTSYQNQDAARTSGQRILQSLASHGPVSNATNVGGQGPVNQFDPASIMSQVMQSPALNGLLSGVSDQAGVGSPNMLRNMLEQFTQNPMMRNTINQIAQQVDSQDIGNMFSGLGGGQGGGGGGGIDLSRMIQQMMPIVSQALGDVGGRESFPAVETVPQPQYNDRRPDRDDQTSQIDLQQAAQRIAHHSPPSDIFQAVVENAGRAYGDVNSTEDLVGELSNDEELANEFVQMLKRDVRRRLEED